MFKDEPDEQFFRYSDELSALDEDLSGFAHQFGFEVRKNHLLRVNRDLRKDGNPHVTFVIEMRGHWKEVSNAVFNVWMSSCYSPKLLVGSEPQHFRDWMQKSTFIEYEVSSGFLRSHIKEILREAEARLGSLMKVPPLGEENSHEDWTNLWELGQRMFELEEAGKNPPKFVRPR